MKCRQAIKAEAAVLRWFIRCRAFGPELGVRWGDDLIASGTPYEDWIWRLCMCETGDPWEVTEALRAVPGESSELEVDRQFAAVLARWASRRPIHEICDLYLQLDSTWMLAETGDPDLTRLYGTILTIEEGDFSDGSRWTPERYQAVFGSSMKSAVLDGLAPFERVPLLPGVAAALDAHLARLPPA